LRYCLILLIVCCFSSNAQALGFSQRATLDNGLEIIVIPNTKVPAVTHTLWYKAGSIDEPQGQSGIAHFLEHLMFKGTPNVPKGEFSSRIAKLGGSDNAFTSHDYTGYYQNIPKEHLATVMELESDRMQHIAFTQEDVLRERNVILEERRMRIENNPQGLFTEQLKASLFLHHPYHNPLIGWMHEMETLSLKNASDWFHRYYAPNNAVLIVSGDITMDELLPLAKQYYGPIQSRIIPPRIHTTEPPARAERIVMMHDPKIVHDELYRYYQAPTQTYGDTQHAYALTVLSYLLAGSQTSTLYQQLVVDQQYAASVSSNYDDIGIGPSIFAFRAIVQGHNSINDIEAVLDDTIEHVKSTPFSQTDIERATNALAAEAIYARENLKGLAFIYGQTILSGLDQSYVENWEHNITSVTAEDIMAAANHVFVPQSSVTGYLMKEEE